jgi:hypothetical protein
MEERRRRGCGENRKWQDWDGSLPCVLIPPAFF